MKAILKFGPIASRRRCDPLAATRSPGQGRWNPGPTSSQGPGFMDLDGPPKQAKGPWRMEKGLGYECNQTEDVLRKNKKKKVLEGLGFQRNPGGPPAPLARVGEEANSKY